MSIGVIGEPVQEKQDLFWPGNEDKGYKLGSIMFSAINPETPGFIKEFSPQYGEVWRRISSAEIEKRRRTTLWR